MMSMDELEEAVLAAISSGDEKLVGVALCYAIVSVAHEIHNVNTNLEILVNHLPS